MPRLAVSAPASAASIAASGMPSASGGKLALHHLVVAHRRAAGDGAGMARIEHRPDIGALDPDRIDHPADLVVDQRVLHLADGVLPGADVDRQEHLVEPVELGRGIGGGLLAAVAGEMDIDEIALLRLRRHLGEGGADRRQRRPRRAVDAVGKHDDVIGIEVDRGVVGEIAIDQRMSLPGPLSQYFGSRLSYCMAPTRIAQFWRARPGVALSRIRAAAVSRRFIGLPGSQLVISA